MCSGANGPLFALIVGASLKTLFSEGRWALLPEESIINGYFDNLDMVRRRENFPEISVCGPLHFPSSNV